MCALLLQELPPVLGRSLERELDDIVPVLLKKAGELSTAGAWRLPCQGLCGL